MLKEIRIADAGTLPNDEKLAKNVVFDSPDSTYIRNFTDIRASTMTLVALLKGQISDLAALGFLLPVVRPDVPSSMYKAGDIISYRWRGVTWGASGGFFKNAAIVDVWTGEKRVSTHLSCKKIQMCGCSNEKMGMVVGTAIVDAVNNTLNLINDINNDRDLFIRSAEWLIKESVGRDVVTEQHIQNFDAFSICESIEDNCIKWTDKTPPESFIPFIKEITSRCKKLDYISDLKNICLYISNVSYVSDRLDIEMLGRSMVNYNYKLGFNIDRTLLAAILKEEYNMYADFVNVIRPYVRVEVYASDLLTDEDRSTVVRRLSGPAKQSFLVYLSGNIMHSGPGGKSMEHCYYNFMSVMAEIKDRVSFDT